MDDMDLMAAMQAAMAPAAASTAPLPEAVEASDVAADIFSVIASRALAGSDAEECDEEEEEEEAAQEDQVEAEQTVDLIDEDHGTAQNGDSELVSAVDEEALYYASLGASNDEI